MDTDRVIKFNLNTLNASSSLNTLNASSSFDIISGGTIALNATTIDLQTTTTTTSTANHNAEIKTTSNGIESTTFLKVKLNGNYIWIPYFTVDPSI